jgi:uncharacterized protein (DUF2062 family)
MMFFLEMAWYKHPILEVMVIGSIFLAHFVLMVGVYALTLHLAERFSPSPIKLG